MIAGVNATKLFFISYSIANKSVYKYGLTFISKSRNSVVSAV